jgi:antitoxin component YwqK of YwqJK toxin-antitoxin module
MKKYLTSTEKEVVALDDLNYHREKNEIITGIVEGFYSTRKIRFRGNLKDGKEDGLWEWFYENGKIWERGNFIDGKRQGRHEHFDEDGNLTETLEYNDGELINI